jgi:hypothetical protein
VIIQREDKFRLVGIILKPPPPVNSLSAKMARHHHDNGVSAT